MKELIINDSHKWLSLEAGNILVKNSERELEVKNHPLSPARGHSFLESQAGTFLFVAHPLTTTTPLNAL